MIAREGLPFILIGLAIASGTLLGAVRWDSRWLFGLSLLFAVLTVFVVFFFRDPDRTFASQPGALVAPADGKIIAIKELDHNEYIGGGATQVSIFLSVFDVHINRVPVAGKIEYVKYNPGKFLAAFNDKASLENEQTEIGLMTADDARVIFKQIAGLIARRIVCNLDEGDDVVAGDRFGLIRFGSRTDLIVPKDATISVKLGDKVKGGETIVGYLASEKEEAAANDQRQNDVKI
jgi:phosphatidylserine decarboxylase